MSFTAVAAGAVVVAEVGVVALEVVVTDETAEPTAPTFPSGFFRILIRSSSAINLHPVY